MIIQHFFMGPVPIQLGMKSAKLGISYSEMRKIGNFYIKFIIAVFASIEYWESFSFLYLHF